MEPPHYSLPLAAMLKEGVRYIASGQRGFRRRLGHAVLYCFLICNTHGRPTLNDPNIRGYYGATAISALWVPGECHKALRYALGNGSESLELSVPVNAFEEFWPDISRKVLRRK